MPISNDSEKRKRQIANLKTFQKAENATPEQLEWQKEVSIKGALARTEKQREKKTLRETCLTLLNTPLTREQAENMIGDKATGLIDEKDLTMQTVLSMRLMQALLEDGNAKAYELLRDTSGQAPKQAVEIDNNITMSDADRALMDKINRRLSVDGEQNAKT